MGIVNNNLNRSWLLFGLRAKSKALVSSGSLLVRLPELCLSQKRWPLSLLADLLCQWTLQMAVRSLTRWQKVFAFQGAILNAGRASPKTSGEMNPPSEDKKKPASRRLGSFLCRLSSAFL